MSPLKLGPCSRFAFACLHLLSPLAHAQDRGRMKGTMTSAEIAVTAIATGSTRARFDF